MTKKINSASVLAVCVALTACATANPEKALQHLDTPQDWKSLSDVTSVNRSQPLPINWVSSLDDPQLSALILEAMQHNTDLGAAAARVKIAKQTAVQVRGGLLPALQGTISGRQDDSNTGGTIDRSTGTFDSSRDSYSATVGASWEVDLWLRATDGTRASYRDAAASRADYEGIRLSIAGGVAQSWYSLVSARLQRELAERDVATGEANLRITERRYERGVSSSLDVRLARSSLAASQASLISRQQTEKEAARALEVLLGRYPSAEITAAESLPTLSPFEQADGSIVGLGSPDTLLDSRPDILASENRLMAEGLRNRQARKNILPSLQVTGSAVVGSAQFSDLFDVDTLAANVAGSLTQTLFAGGRLTAARKQQKAVLEQAVYNYVGTVLGAFAEVENAISAETFLAAREEALKLAFEEAEASEKLTERQYINGTRNIFNLIQAQQRRISNESQYIAARQQRLNNRIQLYMALGGTFDLGEEKITSSKPVETKDQDLPLFSRWWAQSNKTKADQPVAAGAQ